MGSHGGYGVYSLANVTLTNNGTIQGGKGGIGGGGGGASAAGGPVAMVLLSPAGL